MFEFSFTQSKVSAILNGNPHAGDWFAAFEEVLPAFGITTLYRVAAFLAQTGHETGSYTLLHENLNYKAESLMRTWPKRFPTLDIANQYARQPEKIANKVYSSRMGNGDEASGEGWKFRGRGPIQITGKENYIKCSESLYGDLRLIENPNIVEMDKVTAVKSACWYWSSRGLNEDADKQNMEAITKKINGGLIGFDDRLARYHRAIEVLQG